MLGRFSPFAWAKFGFYLILTGCVYSSTLHWLVTRDWPREDYNSSYFVPFIALYLLWEKREALARLPSVPAWKGFLPLCAGVALFWLGELSGEFYTLYISLWLVVVGLCWLHLGWDKLKTVSFPLAFSLTMFPLPNFINTMVTLKLKLISSQLGVAMMRLYGMSAYREGNVIDVGFTQLQVVDACSGLRYFIPLVVLSILLAYYFKGAFWKKGVIVLSAVPVSVVTNGLRIASVGILYQFWGPKVAEGFFHDFSGWFIFMFSLGLLLIEMWALKRLFPEKAIQKEGKGAVDTPSVLSSPFQHHENGWLRALLAPPQFVVAVVFLGATFALSQGINFHEKTPATKPLDQFPLKIGDWSGVRTAMEQMYLDALKFDDYVMIDFKNRQGRDVGFYTAYYGSQSKGGSIHSPATCLPGGGWIFEESGECTFSLKTGTGTMRVNRAYMQKSGIKELTYYWFPQRGRILTNLYQLKIYAFWDALTRQRTDGALVRIITPVYDSERLADAETRLQGFAREIVPELARFIPQ
ncbi:MAG: EpsI family [Geobacteraceae bacterium]|nr:MAG: EpsI family [Geobacteraceae bacterium]